MDRTIVHAQNVTSRVYQKFMQPSMLSTSQQVLFLQIDKWKDTNISLSCASVTQCKKYYDQKTSYAWKISHMGAFFCSPISLASTLFTWHFDVIYGPIFVLNNKTKKKLIHKVFWIYIIANYLELSGLSQHTVKAKKSSHMGPFFCSPISLASTLFTWHFDVIYGPIYVFNNKKI